MCGVLIASSGHPAEMPAFSKVLFVLVEPLVLVRNATIPVSADQDEWNPYRMVVNVAATPVFACWAMGVDRQWAGTQGCFSIRCLGPRSIKHAFYPSLDW
jgi:hypothetical protein